MQVIIHGWSDESRSFDNLAAYLKSRGGPVTDLYLGDYISMDDEVTFDDVCSAMDKAWTESQLPTAPRSVDVVVHSTGALVVRHWMTQCHSPATNPIHRFLMLAPANFGSPLAHKGRSFVGRVVKGFKSAKRFQTGAHILKGLELASPFSFHLALRDRFGRQRWYGPGQVLATVIVGTDGYSGISAAANEDGSDGTVRVSTANLNPLLVSMDFSNDPLNPKLKPSRPKGKTAFFRVAGLNHSTVALKDLRVKEADELRQLIDRSLSVEDDDFDAFCAESEAYSDRVRQAQSDKRYTQAYQNTVVHLADSAQSDVTDYFIELFAKRSNNDNASDVDERVTAKLQESVLHKVHTYGDNSSYRSLYFNVDRLNKVLIDQGKDLYIAVTAMPDLSTDSVVGYRTMGYNDIGSIRLNPTQARQLFDSDRTVLIRLDLLREQDSDVFTFKQDD